jgi:hypothetical protein
MFADEHVAAMLPTLLTALSALCKHFAFFFILILVVMEDFHSFAYVHSGTKFINVPVKRRIRIACLNWKLLSVS